MYHSVIIITVLCLNFVDHDIGAKVFSQMTEELNDPSLGFSFGVKKLLKMILAKVIHSGSKVILVEVNDLYTFKNRP